MLSQLQLARLALEVLAVQYEYFHNGRLPMVLAQSKALEKKLKQEAERIVEVAERPLLFPDPEEVPDERSGSGLPR